MKNFRLLKTLFFVLIILPILFLLINFDELLILFSKYDSLLKIYISNNFYLSYFLFFFFIFCSSFFNIPGGSLRFILAGYFFGIIPAVINLLISVTFGSFFIYKINKLVINDYVHSKYLLLSKIINKYNQNWLVLIMIRNIPIFPLFFQNIILSTFKITDFKFILTTLIGIFPFILLYSVLGDSFASFIDLKDFDIKKGIDNKNIILFVSSIAAIIILSIIAIVLEKKYKKEFKSI